MTTFDIDDEVTPKRYPGLINGDIVHMFIRDGEQVVGVKWENGETSFWNSNDLLPSSDKHPAPKNKRTLFLVNDLIDAEACEDALEWIASRVTENPSVTIQELWDACQNVEWLVWIIVQFCGEEQELMERIPGFMLDVDQWVLLCCMEDQDPVERIKDAFQSPPYRVPGFAGEWE